jgi:signal transduction histidine kinase
MNQLQLEIQPSAVVPMLELEIDKWQKLHEDRLITLKADKALNDATIAIDKHRIHQVISILMDNAIEYSGLGQPIEIGLNRHADNMVISVHDKGEGISATEIENIFERFVRFSKHDEGLGLGLPIAKAIIEAHSGQIQVESVQGAGSVFSIHLPEAKAA